MLLMSGVEKKCGIGKWMFGSLRKMMGTKWDVMLVGWNEGTATAQLIIIDINAAFVCKLIA